MKVWGIKTFLFLLMTALAGCAVHRPQSVELPAPFPESFIEQTGPGVQIERWWETFEDPNLNVLMEEAFSGNLDLDQAYARLEQVKAVYRNTRSAQLPSLDAAVQRSEEDTPSFFDKNTGSSYILSLAAGYELDLWQKLSSKTRATDFEIAASQEEIMALYITLSAQMVDNYYLSVEQRAQMELTEKTIESFADILNRVEQRYREGLGSAFDVYQARQNLAVVRARRPVFESTLRTTEHALSVLLGHYPERNMAGDVVKLPKIPAAFPSGLPSEILARRPDIEAALLRLKASDARIAVAVAERFPSFNLLGNYGTMSLVFSTGNLKGMFWKALVDAAFPIIDGGRRRAEVDRTRAVFRERLAFYHKTVLAAFQEVEDALIKNRTTEERITRLQEQVDAAGDSFRFLLERYMQGLSDYLPVLTAQGLHFDARSQLLAARRQLVSDRISLARALGGKWMKYEMQNRLRACSKISLHSSGSDLWLDLVDPIEQNRRNSPAMAGRILQLRSSQRRPEDEMRKCEVIFEQALINYTKGPEL